jgi:hypothetical protein
VRLILCSLIASALCAEISGTVRSSEGIPVEGAWVHNLSRLSAQIRTSHDGRFRLPGDAGHVLLIESSDYQPTIKIYNPGSSEWLIILRPDPHPALLPRCRDGRAAEGRVFRELVVKRPRRARESSDIDFRGYEVPFGRGANRVWMTVMSGPTVSHGVPSPQWIEGLTQFEVRKLIVDDSPPWLDVRGRTNDGGYSRWVGYSRSTAEYSAVSKKAATYFNLLLDTACAR